MSGKGYANLSDLSVDSKYREGSFQRILPWHNSTVDAMDIFISELGYDLNSNDKFKIVQEIMVLRHLYAHNSGLINEKFIKNYERIKGINVADLPNIKPFYL